MKIIKNNYILILISILLLILGVIAIKQYITDSNTMYKIELNNYETCQKDSTDYILCNNYLEPIKNRDAISTFGYITMVYNSISVLQILSPLLIIILAASFFHKYLWNGYVKNALTRIEYEKLIKKIYLKTLKFSFVMPVFLIIIFIVSCLISGNFDYEYGINHYGFDAFGIYNAKHWISFMIIYIFNFVLHSIFWINITIFNCKHTKNTIITIIVSYIEYMMIFIIFDLIFAGLLFNGYDYMYYFSLANIWTYSNVSRTGVTLVSTLLATISSFIVFVSYKNKEKILEEISK